MKPRAAAFFTMLAVLALAGCDKNPLGTVESQGHPPVVSWVSSNPGAVYIDTLLPQNGLYRLSEIVTAKVTDPDGPGNIRDVRADFVDPSGEHLFSLAMKDDGIAPDSSVGDGIFTGPANLTISRAMVGRFLPFVIATDASGLQSNRVASSLLVFRRNSPPQISNLVAPDSVHVRYGDTTLIPMSIAASDSDGLADVNEVFFLSLSSSDPTTRFQLRDDGGGTRTRSGDQLAGDGIYSIIIQLVPVLDVTRPRYDFKFQARDATGDTSGSVFHSLFITGL